MLFNAATSTKNKLQQLEPIYRKNLSWEHQAQNHSNLQALKAKDPTPINQKTRHSSLRVRENYIRNIFFLITNNSIEKITQTQQNSTISKVFFQTNTENMVQQEPPPPPPCWLDRVCTYPPLTCIREIIIGSTSFPPTASNSDPDPNLPFHTSEVVGKLEQPLLTINPSPPSPYLH